MITNRPASTILCALALTFITCLCRAEPPAPSLSSLDVKVSIGPFPYDLTVDALQKVTSIVKDNANLYTVQIDSGVPWEAALRGSEFSADLKDLWQRHKNSIAPHHQVYLAIAPLAEDRISWATGYSGKEAPSWARDERHLTPELKQAYANYVLRAVEYFQPQYLNIGVEAGDMAFKRPEKWPLFDELFAHTAAQVRAKFRNVKIGISFALPFLQEKGVLERAQHLIDLSDYVGISFYPYMSNFYEKFGASPLPPAPEQWRTPLSWLHQSVKKPIAICETAYSSETVRVPRYSLTLPGSTDLQSQYIEDLATIARRDKYLFTAFFLSVDYDALMEKLHPGDNTVNLWKRTGFFAKDLSEKPAWSAYRQAWLRRGR